MHTTQIILLIILLFTYITGHVKKPGLLQIETFFCFILKQFIISAQMRTVKTGKINEPESGQYTDH
jgi:hypothetical protein